MGTFQLDARTQPGVLIVRAEGPFTEHEMHSFVVAHNAAVNAVRGVPFRVFVDVRGLIPLAPEVADLGTMAMAHSASQPNFLGAAVLVDSALIAMQHRRGAQEAGVRGLLISHDEEECREHLRRLAPGRSEKAR